ncbi:hypothetical protein ACFL11_00940 [Patescibacteria group bacterium]
MVNCTEILKIIGIVAGIMYAGSLLRVWCYEREINELYNKQNDEIDIMEKRTGMSTDFLNRSIKNIKGKHKHKIEELERKSRFILDKLPFIKR